MGCASSAGTATALGQPVEPKFQDSFTLEEKISDGCYGSVSVCVDRKSQKRHAAKAVTLDNHPRYFQRQKIMTVLGCHESIVGVLRRFTNEDFTCYYLMDLCKSTLPEMLKEQPQNLLDEGLLSGILRQMLQGLHYCHSRNIAHRNIKPESFLVGFDGEVKLSGFSEAVFSQNSSIRGSAGKVPFMSPEMLNGQAYGKETDIWSFGVMAYTMLFGEHPYGVDMRAPSKEKDMAAIIAGGKIQPSYVPVGFPQRSDIARTCIRTVLHPCGSFRPAAHECITLVSMFQLSHDTLVQMQQVLRSDCKSLYNKAWFGRHMKADMCGNSKEKKLEVILEQ